MTFEDQCAACGDPIPESWARLVMQIHASCEGDMRRRLGDRRRGTVSDAEVEAAAKAILRHTAFSPPWDRLPYETREYYSLRARQALEAARDARG